MYRKRHTKFASCAFAYAPVLGISGSAHACLIGRELNPIDYIDYKNRFAKNGAVSEKLMLHCRLISRSKFPLPF